MWFANTRHCLRAKKVAKKKSLPFSGQSTSLWIPSPEQNSMTTTTVVTTFLAIPPAYKRDNSVIRAWRSRTASSPRADYSTSRSITIQGRLTSNVHATDLCTPVHRHTARPRKQLCSDESALTRLRSSATPLVLAHLQYADIALRQPREQTHAFRRVTNGTFDVSGVRDTHSTHLPPMLTYAHRLTTTYTERISSRDLSPGRANWASRTLSALSENPWFDSMHCHRFFELCVLCSGCRLKLIFRCVVVLRDAAEGGIALNVTAVVVLVGVLGDVRDSLSRSPASSSASSTFAACVEALLFLVFLIVYMIILSILRCVASRQGQRTLVPSTLCTQSSDLP